MLKNILILRDEIEEELANIDNLKDNLKEIKNKNLDKKIIDFLDSMEEIAKKADEE